MYDSPDWVDAFPVLEERRIVHSANLPFSLSSTKSLRESLREELIALQQLLFSINGSFAKALDQAKYQPIWVAATHDLLLSKSAYVREMDVYRWD